MIGPADIRRLPRCTGAGKTLSLVSLVITLLLLPDSPHPVRCLAQGKPGATAMDRLDPAQIAADDRCAWHPTELVAVLGSDRGRHWKTIECVAFSPDGKQLASGG